MAEGAENCFLGVKRSLTGKRWTLRHADDRMVLALAQQRDMPEPLARTLVSRGIGLEDAETFLAPTLKSLLPDPHCLKDMVCGAERLASAVMATETVCIFADYDVDGATSAAVLSRFLAAAGLGVQVYVPDRITEGYGPSADALVELKRSGVSLVITVDCGVSAHDALTAARDAELDVMVVDHHKAASSLPPALAIINPNRLDDDSGLGHLAAVGVSFLLAVAVNRRLREAGWYSSRDEPNLMDVLDLVALGTICDMVPLKGLNRAFAKQGLKVMARRSNRGLTALADLCGLNGPPSASDLGFQIGPRINAGGRVGKAHYGASLLTSNDPVEIDRLVHALDQYNRERKEIEHAVVEDAILGLVRRDEPGELPFVWAQGERWHPGVLGIAASRLVERYNRPAFVLNVSGDTATCSSRSIPGFDMGSAIGAAKDAGLLLKGGGHTMAAGFSARRVQLGDVKSFFAERLAGLGDDDFMVPRLTIDSLLFATGVSPFLAGVFGHAEPFGIGNPAPRFAVSTVFVRSVSAFGQNHLRCRLRDQDGSHFDAVAFRIADTQLGRALVDHAGRPFHVAGRLSLRCWNGNERASLIIEDAAVAL